MDETITADLRISYGLTFDHVSPVAGGWMNRKWRLSTDRGELLVKQFSSRRFDRRKLEQIEAALQRQMILEKNGVPCPYIWPFEGRAIRLLDGETAYMVMDFHPGESVGPDTVTAAQMRSLGDACGLMHREFSRLPARCRQGSAPDSRQTLDSLWDHFHTRAQDAPPDSPAAYRDAVSRLEPVLKSLTADFFDRQPRGIGHEDFSPDNILFHGDGVSAILDFDRSCHGFVRHDMGRALLSLALRDGQLDLERVRAFREGCARHADLTLPDMADALRISWCIEIPWWIQPKFFTAENQKTTRFRDEMLWLTAHWFRLDSLLTS